MGSLMDKLNKIYETKQDIKQSLTDKGLVPTNEFDTYPDMINEMEIGIELPVLSNPATNSDIRSGKEVIDKYGNILTGNAEDVEVATPTISVNKNGIITASVTQPGGFISSETRHSTEELSVKGTAIYTPNDSTQIINKGVYLTGDQTINPVSTEDKNITAETDVIIVNRSEGKYINKVTIAPTPSESKSEVAGTVAKIVNPSSGKLLNQVEIFPTPSQTKAITPKTDSQVVTPDDNYLLGKVTVNGDSNLTEENIAKGKSIFGVSGTYTSDATAGSGDILDGKSAYVNGNKVIGTHVCPTLQSLTSDATASASDILSGETAYVNGNKVIGTHVCPTLQSLTSDATASAEDILSGETAYVNGNKVTGTLGRMPENIGDIFASSIATEVNGDWIKADGTVDVPQSYYPTLFSQLGLNENRLSRKSHYWDNKYICSFHKGVYNPDDDVFAFVGIYDHGGYYGDRFGYKFFSDQGQYNTYIHYLSCANNGFSDIIYNEGIYYASCFRKVTNTSTESGMIMSAFTFDKNAKKVSAYKELSMSSNYNMTAIAHSNGFIMAVGIRSDGTISFLLNDVANDFQGSWHVWSINSITNSYGVDESLDVIGYQDQFLVISKLSKYIYSITPNENVVSPTVNSSKNTLSSYFTTIEGIELVNGYAIVYGVYNGKAKIAYTNGSIASSFSWTYYEIDSFIPVSISYYDGRYYILGYSGTTKYLASATVLNKNWVVTEISNNPDIDLVDDIPYSLLVDNDGNFVMGSNIPNDQGSHISEFTPVVKQPSITVNGKDNVFIRSRVGGVG